MATGVGIGLGFSLKGANRKSAPHDPAFIMQVKTNNAGVTGSTSFRITTNTVTTRSAVIDWGDGGATEAWTTNVDKTHTYSVAGTYTIKITGQFRIYFSGATDKLKITSLDNWGDVVWQRLDNAFNGCANMAGNFTDKPILTSCTSLSGIFSGCTAFAPTSMN